MTEIEVLIDQKIKEALKKERVRLAKIVEAELLHTGENAKCFRIMNIFNKWSSYE